MIVMFDSTEVGEIPGHANAVAGYTSGSWPTFPELERRFPHAYRLSIAVNAGEDAECLDIENGNATPEEAPGWFRRQRERGVLRPCLYGSASVIREIEAAMEAAGIAREEYRIWSAHYTGQPHICGAACGLHVAADATQWTDRALGRNLDESLCSPTFFAVAPAPHARPSLSVLTPYERSQVVLFEALRARHASLHPMALRKVRARLVQLRKEVWTAADAEIRHGRSARQAWSFRERGQRYAILKALTGNVD